MAKQGATKKQHAEGTIGGILESKLNEKTIDDAIARLRLDAKGGTLIKKVGALMTFFETRPDGEKGNCDNCGAESTTDLPCCPFCGVGDAPPPAQVPESVVDAAMERLAESGGDVDESDAEERDGALPDDDLKPSTALAPVKAEVVHEGQVEYPAPALDLDKAVREIRELQRGHAACAYMLARKVTEVCKSQVWKTRVGEDGKPAYRTFEQFLEKEANIGRKYAGELLKLFGRFSEDEFKVIGPTKLRLVLQAPEEQQAEVLEKLKGGAGRKEVTEQVRKARADKEMKTSRGQKAPGNDRKTITIAQIEGRKTIPLFKKPAGKITIDDAEPATKLTDTPFGMLELANDVRMWVTVQVHPVSKQLQLRVEFRRVDAK